MRTIRRPVLWCVALALAILVGGCGDGPRPRPQPPEVVTVVQDDAELLHRSPERIGATLDDLVGLGVDWVRITAGWSVIQPTRDGPLQWAALDQAVAMARDRGLEVNLDIAFFWPAWARGAEDYADFAEAVAARYPDTVAFTVWNEPNLAVFLSPQWRDGAPASPARYRRMLYAAVPRIRAAAPGALVLIGATSSLGETEAVTDDTRMAPLTFIRALACDGCPPLPGDGWSHHPYSSELRPWESDPEPETVRIGDLGRLRALLDELYADGRLENDLPLYLTEFGFQTNPPDPTWDTTLREQARWLAEAERIARAEPTVRSVAQFPIRDLPERPGADLRTRWRDYQSGYRFEDGRAKPAYKALGLPLVVLREGGRVRLWGHNRRGAGHWTVTADGEEVASGSGRGFDVVVDADPRATFLLRAGDHTGAPVRGAR